MPRLVRGMSVWYIEYSCYFPKNNKLEKFRVYKGFKQLPSEKEKIKLGDKLVQGISKKLLAGWRPWDQTVYLYHDETQYANLTSSFGNKKHNNSHIHKYLSMFLVETKRRVSVKTYESYQSKTRLFCQWLDENGYKSVRIFEITNDVVKQFFNFLIDDKKRDRATIGKYHQNLDQMFRHFMKLKIIDTNPVFDITFPPKHKDMAARPLADDDMKVFLNYVAKQNEQLFLACLVQFFLCCRPGNELRLLKIQDVDFHGGVVHITEENGKTGTRKITMPEALVELCDSFKINQYPREYYIFSENGKPGLKALGKNYFSRKFAKYRDDLGLPKIYKFYSFKHTGAGKLMESGATLAELMAHLGHTSMESTYAYVRRHFGEKSEKVLNFRPDVLHDFIKR